MFKWKKLGKVFDPTKVKDIPWMHHYAQAPATLLFDDFVRVYFSTRTPADADGQFVSYGAYVDLDRKNLLNVKAISQKPIMPLGERGTFDEFGTYPISVIPDGDKVIAYYGGWTRPESVPFDVAIGMAISNDLGETFEKIGSGGPILGPGLKQPFIISGPKIRYINDRWFLYYIAGEKWLTDGERPEPVYKIRLAVSENGLAWNRSNEQIIALTTQINECQASPDVIFKNGKYHMFFCYRYSTNYRSGERAYRIGYASSDDGLEWLRDDTQSDLTVSESGWDSEMVSYPHVFDLDGKTYMLYLGNEFGREGFGLAELQP